MIRSFCGSHHMSPSPVPSVTAADPASPASAAQTRRSVLGPGRSSAVGAGVERGQQHCFICESAAKPVVIVFARNLSDPLGKLVKQLDGAVKEHKTAELRAWVTFLGDDQTALDPKVVQWAQKHAAAGCWCAVFEDKVGPPTYQIAHDADVTVLLSVKQKVVANFAYRAGELNGAAIAEIVKSIPNIVSAKK